MAFLSLSSPPATTEVGAMKHCQICPNPFVESNISYALSYAELCESADAGCAPCTFIRDGIVGVLGDDAPVIISLWIVVDRPARTPADDDESGSSAGQLQTPRNVRAEKFRIEVSIPRQNKSLELYTDDERVSRRWPYIPTQPYVPVEPWTAASARKWLETCVASHQSCARGDATTRPLPTRVVAVGSATRDPFVYESGAGERGAYACLSYCWGRSWTFTTTRSTIRDRKAGFRLEELPDTLRDAVVVARTLGIAYIWIDQLCIVQDSQADWEVEAANMCSVYANAVLTLAALDAPAASTGLFVSRSKRGRIGGVVLDTPLSDHRTTGKVYVRERPVPTRWGFMHDMGEQLRLFLGGGVLNSRLWTLQEAALSRRILWFSAYELGWSCVETKACECEPLPKPNGIAHAWELPHWLTISTHLRGALLRRNWLRLWADVVVEATMRTTTHQTDRLPAIAGLAAEFEKAIGCRYLAGLWEREIDVALLWHCRDDFRDGRSKDHPRSYNATSAVVSPITEDYAPSWTWASAEGPIVMSAPFIEPTETPLPLWRVVAVDFVPTSLNVYGPGKGVLTLEGILVPLLAEYDDESGPVSFHFTQGNDADRSDFDGVSASEWYPDHRNTTAGTASLDGKELYFSFAGFRYNEYEKAMLQEGEGLILEKIQAPDLFNRIAGWRAPGEKNPSGASRQKHSWEIRDGHDVYRRVGMLTVHAEDKSFVEDDNLDEWRHRVQKKSRIFHII